MAEKRKTQVEITNRDRTKSGILASAMFLDGDFAEATLQLLTGAGDEARNRKVYELLVELVEKTDHLREMVDARDGGDPERSLGEVPSKSDLFRDRVLNSTALPPGQSGLETLVRCLEILREVDDVGLTILARVARADRDGEAVGLTRFDGTRWFYLPKGLTAKREVHEREGRFEDLEYEPYLVEEQLPKLDAKSGLVTLDRQSLTVSPTASALEGGALVGGARGSYGTAVEWISLTPKGEMLVKGILADA